MGTPIRYLDPAGLFTGVAVEVAGHCAGRHRRGSSKLISSGPLDDVELGANLISTLRTGIALEVIEFYLDESSCSGQCLRTHFRFSHVGKAK